MGYQLPSRPGGNLRGENGSCARAPMALTPGRGETGYTKKKESYKKLENVFVLPGLRLYPTEAPVMKKGVILAGTSKQEDEVPYAEITVESSSTVILPHFCGKGNRNV